MENTPVTMVSLGEKLRNAREKRSLTVEQVQKQTHIHSTVILALEEGRCDEILTPTYVKSFLKSYSQFLGLDPRDMLKEYSRIHGEESRDALPSLRPGADGGVDIVSKLVYGVVVLALALAMAFALIFLWHKAGAFIKGIKRHPSGAVTAKAAAQAPKKKTPEPQPKQAIQKKAPFTLVLRTKKAVRVKLKKDGVALFERVLPKGLSESFSADEKIELDIARGESVELVLNGKFLGSPGKGVIRNLEITKNGIKAK